MKYVNSVHPRDSGLMARRIIIYGHAKDKYFRVRKMQTPNGPGTCNATFFAFLSLI